MSGKARFEIVDYNCKHLAWAKNLDDAQIEVNILAMQGYSYNHVIDQKRLVEVRTVPMHIGNGRYMTYVEGAKEYPGFGMLYECEQIMAERRIKEEGVA